MSPYAVYPSVLGHHTPSYIAPYYGNPSSAAAVAAAGYTIRGGSVPPPGFYTPLVSPPIARHEHPPSQPYSPWSAISTNAYDHHVLHRDDSGAYLTFSDQLFITRYVINKGTARLLWRHLLQATYTTTLKSETIYFQSIIRLLAVSGNTPLPHNLQVRIW